MMQNNTVKTLLAGKILLLQGPMGPFFNDVANWLETLEREAVNVVFNGGDRFYCRHRQFLTYRQTPKEFPTWLKETWKNYRSIQSCASVIADHCTERHTPGPKRKVFVFWLSRGLSASPFYYP
jgi:capsule polysaccharide modification protein KpsS